jgi:hypothetical protein
MASVLALRCLAFLVPLRRLWLQGVLGVQGLMELLMKQRNGQSWTPKDRLLIRRHLRSLGEVAPAIALFALPGGTLLLPLLAWFLDRRQRRKQGTTPP